MEDEVHRLIVLRDSKYTNFLEVGEAQDGTQNCILA